MKANEIPRDSVSETVALFPSPDKDGGNLADERSRTVYKIY